MKHMIKKWVCLIITIAICFSCVSATVTTVNAMTENDVRQRLNEMIKQYPDGSRWSGSFEGASQCFGFAGMVFHHIFGIYMPRNHANSYWLISTPGYDGVNQVGQLPPGQVNANSVKNLLSQAKTGDVIQANGVYGPHTMIVDWASDSGIGLFDCNSDNKGTVRVRSLNYQKFASSYNKGITLYRSKNYPPSQPTEPSVAINAPTDNLEVSGDGVAVMGWAKGETDAYNIIFYVDERHMKTYGTDSLIDYPWSTGVERNGYVFTFDSRDFDDGNHTVKVCVRNTRGEEAWVSKNIVIKNYKPCANLDGPGENETVGGDITLNGWAWGDAEHKIDISVDDQKIGTVNNALQRYERPGLINPASPYYSVVPKPGFTYSWDTRSVSDGEHTIKITVTNPSNGLQYDHYRKINVKNYRPNACIDWPAENQTINGVYNMSCWSMGDSSHEVNVYVDNQFLGKVNDATQRFERPGLIHPSSIYAETCPYPGFSYPIDTKKLSNGKHEITIMIINQNGLTFRYSRFVQVENQQEVTVGDINGDCAVNVLDIQMIQRHISGIKTLTADQKAAADVNGDGNINIFDIQRIQRSILGIQILTI